MAIEFGYPPAEIEIGVIAHETGLDKIGRAHV